MARNEEEIAAFLSTILIQLIHFSDGETIKVLGMLELLKEGTLQARDLTKNVNNNKI